MRIDFYLIEKEQNQEILIATCRLIAKAYQQQHRVYVDCEDQHQAARLDELLWTFQDISFIPHALLSTSSLSSALPVFIGSNQIFSDHQDILMNLSSRIPPNYQQFQRLIEIVGPSESAKQMAREHYRFYREQQHSLHTQIIN